MSAKTYPQMREIKNRTRLETARDLIKQVLREASSDFPSHADAVKLEAYMDAILNPPIRRAVDPKRLAKAVFNA